ncbi:MAG: phosphoribosylanthranilate isomerase [Lachnospiraceae bacterium]|nr:phosphoribosylanthranilate isomerase [Lachnospiraceae bacterium]MBP3609066.1 phosphoribosylanthranilate isomerase [Lachnospiraceae bacterium]
MIKIKLCGLKRACDIVWANELKPDYIGFVFAKSSRRYVEPEEAGKLKAMLSESIKAVGVFADEEPEVVAELVKRRIIDAVQLHGCEDEGFLTQLRKMIHVPVFQAFRIKNREDVQRAEKSSADMILLDAGAGCGETFDWNLLQNIGRPYFLAGGLTPENVADAIERLELYGVDASSSLETEGVKERQKMEAFVEAVRGKEKQKGV